MSNVTPINPPSRAEATERKKPQEYLDEAYCVLDQAWAIVDIMQTLLENAVEPCEGTPVEVTYALQAMLQNAQDLVREGMKARPTA